MKLNTLLPKASLNKKILKFCIYFVVSALFLFCIYQIAIPLNLKIRLERKLKNESQNSLYQLTSNAGITYDRSLPSLKIHIKKNDWDIIAANRSQALQNWVPGIDRQVMVKEANDWVNCKVELKNEKKIEAKIRLKGRLVDHWGDNDYWSLNIALKGENTFQGMKEFSVQHPKTRGYAVEWLFHQLLLGNQLIGLRYNFGYVSINGSPEKLYAFEEGLEKRLIENNQLREGPILKFNTDYNWFYGNLSNINLNNTDIEFYDDKTINSSEDQKKLAILAIEKLNAFRNKKNKTSETFDSKKWSKLFAILDWLGHDHAGHFDNARFYMNPITSLIEPIGRDYQTLLHTDEKPLLGEFKQTNLSYSENWFENLFQDKQFMSDYLAALEDISKIDIKSKKFIDLSAKLEIEFNRLLNYFPNATPTPQAIWETLEYNRKIIHNKLNQNRKRVFAYVSQNGEDTELYLHNADSLPVTIENIRIENKILYQWNNEPWLDALRKNHLPNYQLITIKGIKLEDILQKNASLTIKYPGTNLKFQEPFLQSPSFSPHLASDSQKYVANYVDCKFLNIDNEKKEIIFKTGEHKISSPLIIPEGFRVLAELPLTLDLVTGAFIKSSSPLSIIGQKDQEIKIVSSDKSGGILLINISNTSIFQFVTFENLKAISNQYLNLTGAITCYESQVTFKNCIFKENHSEDYLNIIRSQFQLIQCTFRNSYGDAFDGDFVEGRIEDCEFISSGNDAVDVSGSKLNVQLIKIEGAGDKGLSIGENSQLIGNKITLDHCEIGIAAKDSSIAKLKNIIMSNSHLGFTAYQKKPEFGFATIEIELLTIKDTKVPFLREKNSFITVDGKPIPISDKKVKEMLYGNEFGKKSH